VRGAGAVLLEPIMDVKVTVPEENMGDVLGDMNSRRARVQGMDTEKGRSVVNAKVPLAEMSSYISDLRSFAEMSSYISDLRSFTGGRGVFSMEPSHYERVPAHLQDDIVAKKVKEDEEENS
jgi:elongation factor G